MRNMAEPLPAFFLFWNNDRRNDIGDDPGAKAHTGHNDPGKADQSGIYVKILSDPSADSCQHIIYRRTI